MSDAICRSEVVQRQRRGELSAAERTAYAAHLSSCEDCRTSQRLGRDFDECAALEPGDGARILALSEVARRFGSNQANGPPQELPSGAPAFERHRRPVWARRTLLVAAAVPLLVAAVASAAFGVYRARTTAPDAAPPSAPAEKSIPRAASRRAVPPPREVLPPPVANTSEAPPSVARTVPDRAPSRTSSSAAERFELANAARRGGDLSRAIALYREIERDFPGSAEAAASELRLGNLLLDRGKAGAALEQFDRHVRRSGALVPEALYGRGRALAALDEAAAERQVWTRMLREYSGSPYAAHARRRLETQELSGAAAGN